MWLYGGYVFPIGLNLKIWLFKVISDLEGQGQLPQKTIRILTKEFCTSGPNLVILAWMSDELLCGQAQNGVNLEFQVKFDLEGEGRSVHKTMGILTDVFCIFGPNLVILAWTGPVLSRGQASDWHADRQTDTQTDAGNGNTLRPKLASGKNADEQTVFHTTCNNRFVPESTSSSPVLLSCSETGLH